MTSECDRKDILSYARSLNICKKNKNIRRSVIALKVIRDICNRAIGELEGESKRAERYFNDIF